MGENWMSFVWETELKANYGGSCKIERDISGYAVSYDNYMVNGGYI